MNWNLLIMLCIFIITTYLAINKYLMIQKLKKIEEKIENRKIHKNLEKKEKMVRKVRFSNKDEKLVDNEKDICYLDIKNYGRIKIELFSNITPNTCENFKKLCLDKKYINTPFHRIIKGFMVQGGDIENGDGTGSYSIFGKTFKDENFILKHDKAGLISMANSGKDTNGSQFFIITSPQSHLDGKHVVFGRVISGMDVIYKIERVATNHLDSPIHNILIENCGVL